MATARIKLSSREIQKYLDGKNGMDNMLDGHAQNVLEAAQASAPVVSGAYQESLSIETEHTDRMVKRVAAGVDYALVVEANTGNLARALDSAR